MQSLGFSLDTSRTPMHFCDITTFYAPFRFDLHPTDASCPAAVRFRTHTLTSAHEMRTPVTWAAWLEVAK